MRLWYSRSSASSWIGYRFAALQDVQGELDGTSFSIDDYWQLHLSYGHHAFTRTVMIFFDQPIGDACGLYLSEVAEGGYDDAEYYTVDCDGQQIDALTRTSEEHLYNEDCG